MDTRNKTVPESEAAQRLAEILNRIAKLPSGNLEPPQFFANFLQLAVAATGSRGGAIWVLQAGAAPQFYCHVEMELCGINEPSQQELVIEGVQRAANESKTLVIPAAGAEGLETSAEGKTNQCGYPLFFKPLRAANQVAMVVQMIGSENLSAHDYRAIVGLLDQAGESGERYLVHRRAAVLEDDRKVLARLLRYTEGVHNSLDAERVVYQIANLGRDAIGCDRVVVWIDPAVKRGLRAVSGIDKPDRRAVLMQSLEKLSRHCLEIKKPIVASRDQLVELSEEEELTGLLKGYFNISQLDQIFLQPIKHEEKYVGVLAAEGFEEQISSNLAGVMAAVSSHAGVALANAMEMGSVPMIRPLSRLKKVKDDPKKRRKWIIRLAIVLIGLAILLLMPWIIRIECACELTPKDMRVVESALDGVQIEQIVRARGEVQKGEIIAVLDDLALATERDSARQKWAQELINQGQAIGDTNIKLSQLEITRLENQVKFYDEQIEKCQVRSPIDGTILTAQLERKEGQTLKKGDPICEIADLSEWQLRLDVPQEEIDWVQQGLAGGERSQVEFFLAATPQHKLSSTLVEAAQIGQMARIKDEGNVYEIRIDVSSEDLEEIEHSLRSGMIGRAKISTVSRPLGYVLLRKVIRFFRVTFF